MKILFSIFMFLSFFTVFAQDKNEKEILKLISEQAQMWNKRDLSGFMSYYQQSDQLIFVGKSGVTYGWETVKSNYEKSYGKDQQDLGQLSFEIVETRKLDKKNYLMVGKWLVKKEGKDDLKGFFSLIWQKIAGKWFIIADHSS